jgi:hypothetical protein
VRRSVAGTGGKRGRGGPEKGQQLVGKTSHSLLNRSPSHGGSLARNFYGSVFLANANASRQIACKQGDVRGAKEARMFEKGM